MENTENLEASQSFDERAKTWDQDPKKVARSQAIGAAIQQKLPLTPEMHGFEYGCGTGMLSFTLQPFLKQITLADSSQGMIAVLQEKIQAAAADNMTPLHLDLLEEAAPQTAFDVIYTALTLHHIEDTQRILTIFYALLADNGYLCIADLDQEDGAFHGSGTHHHHNGFEREALRKKLATVGFQAIDFETCYHIEKEIAGKQQHFPIFLMTCQK